MTLRWRPWTRARLLAVLRDDFDGTGPTATPEQVANDVRLGVDPPQAGPARLVAYRRLEASTVWHWRPTCPAWPDVEYVEHLGEPPAGQYCRECVAQPDPW